MRHWIRFSAEVTCFIKLNCDKVAIEKVQPDVFEFGRGEVGGRGDAPTKLSSMFITPAGYKKYRHASWRTERRSAVLPGR